MSFFPNGFFSDHSSIYVILRYIIFSFLKSTTITSHCSQIYTLAYYIPSATTFCRRSRTSTKMRGEVFRHGTSSYQNMSKWSRKPKTKIEEEIQGGSVTTIKFWLLQILVEFIGLFHFCNKPMNGAMSFQVISIHL